jgi:hypothetical protein
MQRIEVIQPDAKPQWGKLNVAQMLAHCNRSVEISLGLITPPSETNWFMRWIVKPYVVGKRPFSKNSPTAKALVIREEKDFNTEKQKLIQNLKAAKERGVNAAWSPSVGFGPMTGEEWGRLHYKHVDHHLMQFGG